MTSDFAARSYGSVGRLGPGSRMAGYLIEEQIGAGGMAVVFRARDEVLGRSAAIKVLSPALASDEEFRVRFLRESRAVAAVDEPHIIPVYAAGEADGGVLYIATRFIAGGDLAMLLRQAGGALAPDRAAALVSQVASALDAAHAAGLVHRDVKPGNILIDAIPGRAEHAYLSDFGLSKGALSVTGLTNSGQFLGTPDYCAPEQIRGAAVDGRADQYALACVAFVLLTGALPFHRAETVATLFAHVSDPIPSLTALRPGLPAAVDAVMARGLAKSPADRFERCGEFAAALWEALVSIGQAPAADGWPESGGWPELSGDGLPWPARVTDAGLPPSILAPPTVTASGMPGRRESTTHPNTAAWGRTAAGGMPPAGGRAADRARRAGASRRRRRRTAVLAGSAAAVLAAAGVTAALALPGSHGSQGSHGSPGTSTAGTRGAALPPLRIGTPALAATFTVPGGGTVNSAQFSPDGELLAATDGVTKGTSEIYVWDVPKRTYLTTLAMPSTSLQYNSSFSFSADDDGTLSGVFLNVQANIFTIYRWNLSTGNRTTIRSFPESEHSVLSGDDSILAFADSSGKQISVQHVGTGSVFAHLTMPGNSTIANSGSDISLDRDGGRLVVGATNGIAYVWDVAKQKIIAKLHYDYDAQIIQVPIISPDGNTVSVYADGNGPPTLLDVATQSNITPDDILWPLNNSTSCAFSTDGRVCGTNSTDGKTVDLWDVATHAHLFTVIDPKDVADGGIGAIGPDDSEVATLGPVNASNQSGQIYLWDIP